MNLNSKETILRRERLHKGIFCLPALLFAVPLIPLAALCFFLSIIHQKANEAFQQLQAQANPSGLIYLPVLALAVPWLLVCLASFVSTWITYLKSEITLTNQRLLFRTGFIMRVSGELPLENIETIFLIEPLLGRIFGFGTISLTSIGGAKFPLRFMAARPPDFHAALQRTIVSAKSSSARAEASAPRAPAAPPTQAVLSHPSPTLAPPAPAADDHSRFMPKDKPQ